MSKKEQNNRNNKEVSKQKTPQSTDQNLDVLPDPQTNLGAIVQRARQTPNSLTSREVLQLQGSIGNRAVGRLLAGTEQDEVNQPKSRSGPVGNEDEKHADTVASPAVADQLEELLPAQLPSSRPNPSLQAWFIPDIGEMAQKFKKAMAREQKKQKALKGKNGKKLRQIDEAYSYYRRAEEDYYAKWPRYREQGKSAFEWLLEFLEIGKKEVEAWVQAENSQQIKNFEKNYLLEAISWAKDQVKDVAKGKVLEKLPGGKVIGLALSFGTKMYETHEHNKKVYEAVGVADYAGKLGIETTSLLFEILAREGSLWHLIGQYDGKGQALIENKLKSQKEDLYNYETRLINGGYVNSKDIKHELNQAKEFAKEFDDALVGFYVNVRNLQQAAARSLSEMRKALNEIKIAFTNFVAKDKGVEILGIAKRQGDGYIFVGQLWKLGDKKWTTVSRETTDYLKDFNMVTLADKVGQVKASIELRGGDTASKDAWLTFYAHKGGMWGAESSGKIESALYYIGKKAHSGDKRSVAAAVRAQFQNVLRTNKIGDLAQVFKLP